MKRFIVVVLDGLGIGYTEDAVKVRPQDVGANTLVHILEKVPALRLPNLEKMGLMDALGRSAGQMEKSKKATYGRSGLAHWGADTFYGHQEIMGTRPKLPVSLPFSQCIDVVADRLQGCGYAVERRNEPLPFLVAEGCVVVADNIEADPGQAFNVTAPLDQIPFSQVVEIGKAVRSVVPVSRVIALGGEGIGVGDLLEAFSLGADGYGGVHCGRSGVYQKGYQVIHLGYGVDPSVQVPSLLGQMGIPVILLGKVADIVANPGGVSIPEVDTATVLEKTRERVLETPRGFICVNVQETDLAGHSENADRYAEVLRVADTGIGKLHEILEGEDVLLVMADHGNDPAIGHNHHTREYVPILLAGPRVLPGCIGTRTTLSDVGATVAEFFSAQRPEYGKSFLDKIRKNNEPDRQNIMRSLLTE